MVHPLIRLLASVAIAVTYSDILCQRSSMGCSCIVRAASLAGLDIDSRIASGCSAEREVIRWTTGDMFDDLEAGVRMPSRQNLTLLVAPSAVSLGLAIGISTVYGGVMKKTRRATTTIACAPVFCFSRRFIVVQSQVPKAGVSWTMVNVHVGKSLEIHVTMYEVRYVQMTTVFKFVMPSLPYYLSARCPVVAIQDNSTTLSPSKSDVVLRGSWSLSKVSYKYWRQIMVAIPTGEGIIVTGWMEIVVQTDEHVVVLFRIYYPHLVVRTFSTPTKTQTSPCAPVSGQSLGVGLSHAVISESLHISPKRLLRSSESSMKDLSGWSYLSRKNIVRSLLVPSLASGIKTTLVKRQQLICASALEPASASPRKLTLCKIVARKPKTLPVSSSSLRRMGSVARGVYSFVPRTRIPRCSTPAMKGLPSSCDDAGIYNKTVVKSDSPNLTSVKLDKINEGHPKCIEIPSTGDREDHFNHVQDPIANTSQSLSPTTLTISIRIICAGTEDTRKAAKVVDVQVPLEAASNKVSVDIELDTLSESAVGSSTGQEATRAAPLLATEYKKMEENVMKINEKIDKVAENVEEMKRSLKEDIVKTLLESLRQASENKPATNEAEKNEKPALSVKDFSTSPNPSPVKVERIEEAKAARKKVFFASPRPSPANTTYDADADNEPENCVTSFSLIAYSPVVSPFKNIMDSIDRPSRLAPHTPFQEFGYVSEEIDPAVSPTMNGSPRREVHADDVFGSSGETGPLLIPKAPGYLLALYDKRAPVSPSDRLASAMRRAKRSPRLARWASPSGSEMSESGESYISEQMESPRLNMSQIIAPIKSLEQTLSLDVQSSELKNSDPSELNGYDVNDGCLGRSADTRHTCESSSLNAGAHFLNTDEGFRCNNPIDRGASNGDMPRQHKIGVTHPSRPHAAQTFQLKSRFVNADAATEQFTQILPPTPSLGTTTTEKVVLVPNQIRSSTPLCSPTKESGSTVTIVEGSKYQENQEKDEKIQIARKEAVSNKADGKGIESSLQSLAGLVATRLKRNNGISSAVTGKDGLMERLEQMKRNMAKSAKPSGIPVPTLRRLLLDKRFGPGFEVGARPMDKSHSLSPASTLVNYSGSSGFSAGSGSSSGAIGDMKANVPSKIPRFTALSSRTSCAGQSTTTFSLETRISGPLIAPALHSPESWGSGWKFEKAMSQETRIDMLRKYRNMRKTRTLAEEIANADNSCHGSDPDNHGKNALQNASRNEEIHTSFSLCVRGKRVHDESIGWLCDSTSSVF